MLKDIVCNWCNTFLKKGHGNTVAITMTKHFKEKHKPEYMEIKAAELKYQQLRIKYSYNGY